MVVQVLGLHRGVVFEGFVRPERVVEVDPAQGLELDVLDAAPGALWPDQLRLEQPDRGLGQGVVVGVVVRTDRRINPGLDQPLRDGKTDVLRPGVSVVDQPREAGDALLLW